MDEVSLSLGEMIRGKEGNREGYRRGVHGENAVFV